MIAMFVNFKAVIEFIDKRLVLEMMRKKGIRKGIVERG